MREKPSIFDELKQITNTNEAAPRYDIRKLSHEILLRTTGHEYTWINENDTRLTLTTNHYGRFQLYDLYAQEPKDDDVHLYSYGAVNNALQYKYPLFSHQVIDNPDEIRREIEELLLTGPVHDKVAENPVENRIQKMFLATARALTIEQLCESDPEYRTDMYYRYLTSDTDEERSKIIHEIYEKTIELGSLYVGPEQFKLACQSDITSFRTQQKALPQRPHQ